MHKVLVLGQNSKELADRIATFGHRTMDVLRCDNLAEATDFVEAYWPNLIVLSVVAGDYDKCVALVKELRETELSADIPIALVTDLSTRTDWLNVRDVLCEPADGPELVDAIANILMPFGSQPDAAHVVGEVT